MKQYKFYKKTDQWFDERWYIDLPDWTGDQSDLEMIMGADAMLDIMSEGNKEIFAYISDAHFDGADELEFIRMADDIGSGAYYIMKKYKGIEFNIEMWLCDVVLFVFKRFPEKIYIQKTA